MGMIMIQCKYTTHYTYNKLIILLCYIHCVAVFVTMLYILVNIDQDELKLVLVNITQQEKQISIKENN